MSIPFEASRSYVYKSTRYEILPVLTERAEAFGDEPFLLRDLFKPLLQELYSDEQLDLLIKKSESDKVEKMRNIFSFYIPFLAKSLQVFDTQGAGYFTNITVDQEVADIDSESTDLSNDESGLIYAYTFPSLIKREGNYPIKIGLTTTGNAEDRVNRQCRQTCCFEYPQILGVWSVERVGAVESAMHSTLEARGYKRDSPGIEWFDTTLPNIEEIIEFIDPKSKGQ